MESAGQYPSAKMYRELFEQLNDQTSLRDLKKIQEEYEIVKAQLESLQPSKDEITVASISELAQQIAAINETMKAMNEEIVFLTNELTSKEQSQMPPCAVDTSEDEQQPTFIQLRKVAGRVVQLQQATPLTEQPSQQFSTHPIPLNNYKAYIKTAPAAPSKEVEPTTEVSSKLVDEQPKVIETSNISESVIPIVQSFSESPTVTLKNQHEKDQKASWFSTVFRK